MSTGQSRRVLAGCGLMVAILFMLVGVLVADRIASLFRKSYTVYAVFPSAPRLRLGSPVWIGGHQVGKVVSIGFQPVVLDSAPVIAVGVELPRKHQSLVRRNSRVQLSSARLIGEPTVDILPGTTAQPPLEEGDTLYAKPPVSALAAMASWRSLQVSLDSVLVSVKVLAPATARRKTQFARIAVRLANVQADLGDVRQHMAAGSVGRFLDDAALQDAMGRSSSTAQQLGTAFQAAGAQFTDPALRAAFAGLQQRAQAISAQLGELRTRFDNGSLPRFARDTAIMKALHNTQVELDSLIAETRRNPLRFWFGDRPPGVSEPLRRRD